MKTTKPRVVIFTFLFCLSICLPAKSWSAESGSERISKDLAPPDLYEAAWQFINDTPNLGIDKVAWQDWQHKFDGQLASESFAVCAISTAFETIKGPLVELDTSLWSPAEAGVGLCLYVNNKHEIEVANVMRGSPAALAGMLRGDVILAVDGKTLPPWLMMAVGAVRGTGKEGTAVTLKYRRAEQMFDVSLVKSKYAAASENICQKIDGIAYLRPPETMMRSSDLEFFQTAIEQLPGAGCKGLVLDLRDTDVSAPTHAEIAGYFLPANTVLRSEKTQTNSAPTPLKSSIQPRLLKMPMAVLINGGTSSDSELIVAALKHYGRAKLLGQRTAGCLRRVAVTHQLDRTYQVRVWSMAWLPPDGKTIEGIGIQPDVLAAAADPKSGPWYKNIAPGAVPKPDARNEKNEIVDKQLAAALSLLSRTGKN